MAEKKFSVMIFLMAAFAFLAIFIAVWVYEIYLEESTYARKTSSMSLQCTAYSFEIDNVQYDKDAKILSFSIENTYGDSFPELVIEQKDGAMTNVALDGLEPGIIFQKKISNISENAELTAYPKGCRDGNRKTIKI